MSELSATDLRKSLGGNEVLKGISFEIERGEVLSLIGHSGSGKTTILRSIAGLERPDAGTIALGGRPVFDAARDLDLPPEKRGLGLVFQSYALWPNRTVRQNVGYGLALRNETSTDAARRVDEMLLRLGLQGLAGRYPHELSGGQQQRVALARALVYRPRVLLLDEPLSNLDAKLRDEARGWLKTLIVGSGISALYVTHDQIEAMAISNRIILLHEGRVEQEGTPLELYDQPRTAVAASFMGSNNRFDGIVTRVEGDTAQIEFPGASLKGRLRGAAAVGQRATAFIRIERLRLTRQTQPESVSVELETVLYLGDRWECVVKIGDVRVRAWMNSAPLQGPHWFEFDPRDLWIFGEG